MSSPIDKFLKELSSEAAAKAKPAAPRQQVDAVMSDSGLFDVHALVSPAKKPAAPVDTSKSKAPVDTSKSRPPAPAADTSKSKPPAAPASVPGRKLAGPTDAVMSDSGLFDVRGLVSDLKSKKPAGGGSMSSPAALSGGSAKPATPKRADVQDFELFDFRDGVGGNKKPDAKPAGKVPMPGEGSSKVAPLTPPKPPAAPSDDDNNPIMSDSGLFDVRELVAEVNKRPAAPAKPRLPAKAEAPTELGVPPVRRSQEPVRPQGKSKPDSDSKISARPVGKPLPAVDVPSRNNVKPVGAPKTGSGKIPAAMPRGTVVVPGSRSGKVPITPAKPGVGKTTGGKVPSKPPPTGKKPAADLDDIVAHRDDPNTTAEERMARKEAGRQGKAYKPPITDEATEQGSSTATLILLLLVVLAGAGAAFYYFYGLQN